MWCDALSVLCNTLSVLLLDAAVKCLTLTTNLTTEYHVPCALHAHSWSCAVIVVVMHVILYTVAVRCHELCSPLLFLQYQLLRLLPRSLTRRMVLGNGLQPVRLFRC